MRFVCVRAGGCENVGVGVGVSICWDVWECVCV